MVVNRVAERLDAEHGITLTVTDELVTQLATNGFDAEFGARPLKRHVRRTLEKELTRAILSGAVTGNGRVKADRSEDGGIVLQTSEDAHEALPLAA